MGNIDVAAWRIWIPDWAAAAILLFLGLLGGLAVEMLVSRLLARFSARRGLLVRSIVQRTRQPLRFGAVLVGLRIAAAFAPLPLEIARLVRPALLIGFIILLGMAALATLHVAAVVYGRKFRVDVADNLLARKHITQIRILERTAAVFIVVVTAAAALMTLEPVRQYGVTLLASAGAAGIIAGLALQPLLTNLIAGVQIAITQPIRIDDAVIVEGEWGNVEEISSTYVVVRLWDLRRMVLPLTYFNQHPFQNWTRESSKLIGTALLYLDYCAPLDALRARLEKVVRGSPLWDGDVINLAVTNLTERTMEVRCLMSARNAGDAFDLRCLVREQLINFLREEHPQALPTDRLQLSSNPAEGPQQPRSRSGALVQ